MRKNKTVKKLAILFAVLTGLFSLLFLYSYIRINKLESYINLVNLKYQIPSGTYTSPFPTGYKFSRSDAAGIMWVDLAESLEKKYLVDPNHKNKFYWLDSTGKEIDESDMSYYLYIGVPLRPEDIGNLNPEKIPYVDFFYKDLISVFQKSGFVVNPNFSKMEVYGYDNKAVIDIVALENSKGTKCEINKPGPYGFSDYSARIGLGGSNQVGYDSLAFIYVACINR